MQDHTEVTFLPLPQLIKAGTRFSDPRLSGHSWFDYISRWYTRPKTVTHPVLTVMIY